MTRIVAVALGLALGLLGWRTPEMQIYFRIKEVLDPLQREPATYDPELAGVAVRAADLLRACGFRDPDGATIRHAVDASLAEEGRFGLSFVAFDDPDAAALATTVRDYLTHSPVPQPVERVGVALGERALAVLGATRVRLPRLPPERWRASSLLFWGELPDAYRAPEVLVWQDDRIHRLRADQRGRLFYVDLPVAGRGRARVEVQAQGPKGSEVLALFDVGPDAPRGCAALAQPAPPPDPPATPAQAEAALLRWLNEVRTDAGLVPLDADPALARLAREHSQTMARELFVGHGGPTRPTLAGRLQRAKVPFRKGLENVAAAGSVWEAHRGLTDTPSHRANRLDPEIRRAGLGVVQQGGVWFVTEELVAP